MNLLWLVWAATFQAAYLGLIPGTTYGFPSPTNSDPWMQSEE